MSFFALQVRTGDEGRFLSLAKERVAAADASFHWPRRNLRIKRRGVWRDSLAPIFPGYLFVNAAGIGADLYQALLSYFLAFGEIVDKSIAYFDENRRIRIINGPLKGLEGMIIKVDRRKRRARVQLEMYRDSFEIDFGFDFLEAAPRSVHNAIE
jgi:transcriptional antiterminator NusG